MKLSDWARQQGISYQTAWTWFRDDKLPVPARQLPSGTILVELPSKVGQEVALYARVSGSDQKGDLQAQVGRLTQWATQNGYRPDHVVAEVGSGMNGHRKGLLRLLANPNIGTIIVEHRDRLMRLGWEVVEAALSAQGRRLVVVEDSEVKDDLVSDMTSVLTSFCARLYGKRSAKNKARKALEALSG